MTLEDISIIFSIIVLEGLLSVDNALVNASLASRLPLRKQKRAITLGIAAGAILRLIALFLAGYIIKYPVVKTIGALYLIYLMTKHLFFKKKEEIHGTKVELSDVVRSIFFADIAFSLDNVVAAVGMSPKLWVVTIGVMAGIVAMLFATQLVAVLIRRYPLLEKTAYIIVGFIGLSILSDELFGVCVPEKMRFACIIGAVLATIGFEEVRRVKVL